MRNGQRSGQHAAKRLCEVEDEIVRILQPNMQPDHGFLCLPIAMGTQTSRRRD
jgi:hypothetical protein